MEQHQTHAHLWNPAYQPMAALLPPRDDSTTTTTVTQYDTTSYIPLPMPATTAAQAAAVAQEVIVVDEGSDMDEDVEARPAPQADDVAHPSGSTSQSPTPAPPDYDHAVRTADPTTSPIALSQRFRKFIAEAHEIANIVAKCKPRVVETEHVDLMIDMQEAALLPLRAWWSRTELNDDD